MYMKHVKIQAHLYYCSPSNFFHYPFFNGLFPFDISG